ncbi:HAD family hydrolase [Halovivax gelatinilyticus]|uniref:HAD family hydrolase n=1 Tax=Halovivax gelatinilyticus TaxID=2961597 RepID=UPI0020CA98E9|nr:HAD hydrolase-like protein [Halovivax gelatinilyticus]
MIEYDAIVYDLDGTLVHLDVDWDAVSREARDVYRRNGTEPPATESWDLLTEADRIGRREEVDAVIAGHERAGARTSARLPLADAIGTHQAPVGVCSLNCEAACLIALERHGLTDAVDSVVGRDTVPAMKPDPAALFEAVERLPGDRESVLFVGDSRSDEVTAERAGVAFRYVYEWVETF